MAAEPYRQGESDAAGTRDTPGRAETLILAARGSVFGCILLVAMSDYLSRDDTVMLAVMAIALAYVAATSIPAIVTRMPHRLELAITATDVVIVTVIVISTGGLKSSYYPLYYLPVLQACVRVRFRDAVGAAVLAAGLYSFVCLAEGLNVPVATVSYLRLATFVTLCVFFAVMSAQLMRETRAHREKALQLELLAGVTRELQSSLRLGELLQSIAVSTREAFGHEQVAIYLGEEADQLSLQAGSPPDEPSSAQPPAALGFAREAVANGRIAVSRGTAPANAGVELGDDALPTIAVPLTVQGETAGALVIVAGPRFRFSRLTITVLQTLADLIGDAIRNAHLYEHTLFGVITALSLALDAKSHQARGHSQRVSVAAVAIARELDLSERHRTAVRLAALLHDIGKIGVADRILNGPTGLSADELEELRGHPESGAEMLASIPQLEAVARIIRHHHERLDGGGYPDGLAGEEIPLGARIIAVADAIDAIIFERTYGDIHTEEEAVAEVQAHAGSQFDPEVVAAATRVYERTGRLIGRPGVVPISAGVYDTAIHDDPPDSELTAS